MKNPVFSLDESILRNNLKPRILPDVAFEVDNKYYNLSFANIFKKIKLQFLSKNKINPLLRPLLVPFAQIWTNKNFPKKSDSVGFWQLLTSSNIHKIRKIWEKLQTDRLTDGDTDKGETAGPPAENSGPKIIVSVREECPCL